MYLREIMKLKTIGIKKLLLVETLEIILICFYNHIYLLKFKKQILVLVQTTKSVILKLILSLTRIKNLLLNTS